MLNKKISPYVIPGLRPKYQKLTGDNFVKLLIAVAKRYDVDPNDLLDQNRVTPLPYVRSLLIHFIRREFSQTGVKTIGKMFANRDHSTIIVATRKFQNRLDTDELTDKKLKSQYSTVREDYLQTTKYLNSCL